VTCRVGLKECQEQLTRLFGQSPVLMSRLDTPDTVSISGLKCTATVNSNQCFADPDPVDP
jgi:hypothetical protein